MTWTYDSTTISSSQKDQVRFIVGDTIETQPLVEDEEIEFTLARRNSVNGASAMVARAISAKLSRLSDTTVGPQKLLLSQKAVAYKQLADDLEGLDDATGGAIPYCGGINLTDKQTIDSDTTRVQPGFVKNMTDYPVAGGQQPQNTEDIPYWGDWP